MEFVCFKWRPAPGYRSSYGPAQVNTLLEMLGRHYDAPFRLSCVTDEPTGISKAVRVIPLWDFGAKLQSPHGTGNPSCYRRLPLWGDLGAELIGPRFATLDLDICIVADVRPVFDVPDDFRIWGDTAKGTPYNGSVMIQNAGARRQVWDMFDPVESPKRGRALGYIGSDQAWIAACLGPHEKKWTKADGIYSYRNEIAPKRGPLPDNARIVVFHGFYDPWHPTMRAKHDWVRRFYK